MTESESTPGDDHDVGGRPSVSLDGVYTPEEAFAILGNEIRLSILLALWEAPSSTTTFSELRERTPVETDNFHYHLNRLLGHFVHQDEEGYSLRFPGEAVVSAMIIGTFSANPTIEREVIEATCPYCESPLELGYDNGQVTARCTDCAGHIEGEGYERGTLVNFDVPPSGIEGRDREELLRIAHILYDSKIAPMMDGVCPECAADVEFLFRLCEDHEQRADGLCDACNTRFAAWVDFRCTHCGYRRLAPPWFRLLTEPSIIAFYHEHADFDQRIPFSKVTSENARYIRSIEQEVISTDPVRIRVTFDLDDVSLEAITDERLEIVSMRRS